MKRREALRNTGLLVGLGLTSGVVTSTIFQSCREAQNLAPDVWKPQFIPTDMVAMVAEMAETLLPRTDTPGAKDVKVHQFLDAAWATLYPKEESIHIKQGLLDFAEDCKKATGKVFLELSPDERLQHLKSVQQAFDEKMKGNGPLFWGIPIEEDKEQVRQEPAETPLKLKPFWHYFRERTLQGYFTSEEVGENILTYQPVPGDPIACMDLEPGMHVYSL